MMIQVDIWSDVRCPFCYIGKHKFEAALEQFPEKNGVVINWHSFQLDPNLETQPAVSSLQHFMETKNVGEERARQMFGTATKMAEEMGLDFNLETSVVANSNRAHQLIQLSKEKKLANELKEALFRAHFTEGKNIDDPKELLKIAASAGVPENEAREALETEEYAYNVKQDEMQARNIGVQGVPFFVFDNKYAVSGAQPTEVFLEVLEKVMKEKS